jgi:hypothetical protein
MNRVAKKAQLTQAEFTNTFAQAEEIEPNDLPKHFALIIAAAR